jgi:penicillin-binding protein 1A
MRRLLRWALYAAGALVLAAGAVLVIYGGDLPPIDRVYDLNRRPQIVILDANGRRLAVHGDAVGPVVRVRDLPRHVPAAVIAVEDRRFYRHFGLDPIGLGRAAFANLAAGRIRQGGSTITQQLAKIAFLTPERSYGRKIREALLALRLERRFSKDELLAIYLNRAYFGGGVYGIDGAARRYFGRPASALTVYQAAMLAGILRAPARYSPHVSPERARDRAATVLAAMVESGALTAAAAASAKAEGTRIVPPPSEPGRRYFTDWVLDLVPNYVTLGADDIVVRTTLVAAQQDLAERLAVAAIERDGGAHRVGQVAMVVLAPDGAVRAMVGGLDYQASQFNRAVQARRQPGSAFKLFVLLAALEAGIRPGDAFRDAPVTVKGWSPRNFANRYLGEVTLAEAMAQSLNSVAVRVTERVGPRRVAAVARRLGIKSPIAAEMPIALGVSAVSLLELTGAFAVLAHRGRAAEPYAILEIRTQKGVEIFKRRPLTPTRLVSEAVAADATGVLAGVLTRGTARRWAFERPAAGKSGTTQDSRDAWFVGYTAELVAGVWFGNDDRAPMRDATGGGLAARLWAEFMTEALKGRPPAPLLQGQAR